MKLIVGQGKTSELIEMAKEGYFYIVCNNHQEAHRIHQEANYEIPFPLTYNELALKEYYPFGIKGFLIDNLEMFLAFFIEVPIIAVTGTFEIKELTNDH